MIRIKQPVLRTVITILLGLLVLILSSALMLSISTNTNLFEEVPIIGKTFTHSSMLVLSILLIIILNKGNLREYGFNWNRNYPFFKIVFLSLAIGFISSLIILLINTPSIEFTPTKGFTLIEQIAYIWIWASICEEVFTRGLIQGFLSPLKHIGIKISKYFFSLPVIVGAIFFGAMHLMLLSMGVNTSIVLNIVIFGIILGLIAGYYKEKSNSLVPAIIVHACFNIGGSILEIISLV